MNNKENNPNIANLGPSKIPGKGYMPRFDVSDDEARKKRLSAYAEKIRELKEDKNERTT